MEYAEGNKSEVARIRHQIEMESRSMVHAQMFAVTASHEIINRKFKALDTLTKQLGEHMPKEQAMQSMIESYNAAIEKAQQETDEPKQVL